MKHIYIHDTTVYHLLALRFYPSLLCKIFVSTFIFVVYSVLSAIISAKYFAYQAPLFDLITRSPVINANF